jgi:glycosyltransferase involved in cell wall biosynthesis
VAQVLDFWYYKMVKNPKKILIFSVAYYPKFVGGAEVAVKEITDRLDPDEYEFHLITLRLDKNLPKNEKIGNVFVYRICFAGEMKESADSLRFPLHYNKYLFPFVSVYKALKLSKKHDFNLNWAIMANYSGFGALFFKLLKPKIPFLLTLQEGDPTEYIEMESLKVGTGNFKISVHWFMKPVFKMIFKRADFMQVISKFLADWGKKMGFKKEPVVVPNGVDVSKFKIELPREERTNIRKELNLEEKDVALITTSRLVIKNGVGDVIKALPKLPKNVKFVIFGEGYMDKELKELAKNLNVSERVNFKGFVSHNEMPKYLKACDIFTRPSLSEGLGNSFIEAMAAKLPVIATPVGGIVDFVFQDKTGYFCQPENPESIAETVKKIISDHQKNKIIEKAYNMVLEKYDWSKIAEDMKEVFISI